MLLLLDNLNHYLLRFKTIYCLLFCILLFASCNNGGGEDKGKTLLTVFHAGSLSAPMNAMADEFEKQNPGVKLQLEAAGSVICTRKITDLNRACDILALADYTLIDRLLIPKYASWAMEFASNELCIAYNEKSKYSDKITDQNWFDIINRDDVKYARSDPNSDPCGYRTVLCLKLADKFYEKGVDYIKLLDKDRRYIRPKETDLLALLETKNVDYIFQYTSVAVQHNLRYLKLPDSINLSNPDHSEFYSSVSVDIAGKKPGSVINIQGQPMIYGFTIPINAPNPEWAKLFAKFMMDPEGGLKILKGLGQKPIRIQLSPGSVLEAQY
jgi:molybdate/tungstate transport system substrate-binding protein